VGGLTDARILIADDEAANVRLLERLLAQAGYANVRSTTDSREIRALYEDFKPDLILLDLMMPHLDGVAVMQQLPIAAGEYVPILVLTADVTAQAKERALTAGAKDFLTKPFDRTEVLLRIKNLLDTRFLYCELDRQNRSLEEIVAERTERLLQSEKVATMGSLLAGVAHELNNPLAVLIGQTTLLRESMKEGPVAARAVKIGAAADRCARIVRNFLSLARQRPTERSAVHLNSVIREAVEMLAYELRSESVEVTLDLAEGLPELWADAHQLHQVLVNLVTNAHHAMKRQRSVRRITVATGLDETRGRVRLTIADTGPGIPVEIVAKVFEPFFTTKPPGEGTGLGLALCRNIIEGHGGTISIDAPGGPGTRFVIELSPSERATAATPAPALEALPPVSPKRVLVVDDEPDIAGLLVEVVAAAGHRVDVATDGAAALDQVARHQYDLVLSDTKMPLLDGVQLYHELERRAPLLCGRIVFLTGDVLDRSKREFLESTGAPFLTKPFDVTEVRRLVHRMLAATKSPKGSSHV
jgi:two-component system NtrC family sensor kinase